MPNAADGAGAMGLDPKPYQARVDQMIAARDRDQAQLGIAQDNLLRRQSSDNRAKEFTDTGG